MQCKNVVEIEVGFKVEEDEELEIGGVCLVVVVVVGYESFS